MKQYTSNDWQSLLTNIKLAKNDLGNPDIIWYRGQSNSKYTLVPSLLRLSNGIRREKEGFLKFKQIAKRLENASDTNDWELLFRMQHYWIPTRLLDWSEVVGIPLFFAAKYNLTFEKGDDAALFLLDPLKLNEKSSKRNIPRLPDDKSFDYHKIYFNHDPFAPTNPIAVIPDYNHNRLLAQKGVFTIHPDTTNPLESLTPDCVVKINITKDAIPEILQFCEIADIDEMSVFPDIQGAAEYLRRMMTK